MADDFDRKPPRRGYIPELDGMRGVAIGLVILYHCWLYRGPGMVGGAVTKLASTGWAGVDVFFVMSGYLITGILLDSKTSKRYWRNFYIRRSLRIFPLYYAVMTIVLLAGTMARALDLPLSDPALGTAHRAWINYLYLTNFAVGIMGHDYVPLDIAWSLAIEEQFYLVYPFLIRLAPTRTVWRWLIGAIVLAPALRLLCHLYFFQPTEGPYALPFCRMDALAFGGLAALVMRQRAGAWRRLLSRFAPGFALVAAAMLLAFGRGDTLYIVVGYSVVALASTALLVRVLEGDAPLLTRIVNNRPLIFIGKISYGLYLLHLIARAAVDQGLLRSVDGGLRDGLWQATLRLALIVGVSIVGATVSFYAFERPILKLKDRFAPPTPAPTPG